MKKNYVVLYGPVVALVGGVLYGIDLLVTVIRSNESITISKNEIVTQGGSAEFIGPWSFIYENSLWILLIWCVLSFIAEIIRNTTTNDTNDTNDNNNTNNTNDNNKSPRGFTTD